MTAADSVQDPAVKAASPPAEKAGSRHAGIDLFRWFAFVAVVCIHTATMSDVSMTAGRLARWAVPFYFIVSGYFIGRRFDDLAVIWRSAKRIIPLFAVWALVYLYARESWPETAKQWQDLLINGGSGLHLWYLPSLLSCIAAVALLKRWLDWPVVLAVAGLVFVAGLLFGSYSGLTDLNQRVWNPRNGPVFGLLFVALGGWAATVKLPQVPQRLALLAFAVFLATDVAERVWLSRTGPTYIDFTLSTLFVAVSAFVVARGWDGQPFARWNLDILGKYSFGMYAVHMLFLYAIHKHYHPKGAEDWAWTVTATVVLSTVTALLLSRIPFVRRFVQ